MIQTSFNLCKRQEKEAFQFVASKPNYVSYLELVELFFVLFCFFLMSLNMILMGFDMILVCFCMILKVGINMTTNVGMNRTSNVGIHTTTNVGTQLQMWALIRLRMRTMI